MFRMSALLAVGLLSVLFTGNLSAQSLRESLKDIPVADHWIYDDLPAAIAQAKESGKPLLVVLRCVPCPPGRTLDEQVMQPAGDLAELEKQFVCVRVIQTNGLDLDLFQYDYDMSWACMFLNADLTVYGRYGTRNASGKESDGLLSKAGFEAAAKRALALHKAYPANKAELAGKSGKSAEYDTPTEIPGLTDKPAKATARQQCIHCHMVKEYALRAKWEAGQLSAADLYVYPMPERIGLTLDTDDGLKVKSVRTGSPAAVAGIASGDVLQSLGGQPLVSTADVQWVLHQAATDAELAAQVQRGGKTLERALKLSGDWKKADIAWRASSWYGLRQGVKFEPAGGDRDGVGLKVSGLFGRGGPKVKEAGLRMGDIIVAVDGKTDRMSESDFLVYLRLTHGPGDSVKLTVQRGSERAELTIPLW